jgi:RecB family exonuclease
MISKAVELLLQVDDLSDVTVLVPTQRFATFVTLGLAQRNSSLWLPKFQSFEDYLQDLTNQKVRPVESLTAELFLAGILLEGRYQFLKPGLEREILVFWGMAIENGNVVFRDLEKSIEADVFRSERGALRIKDIIAELKVCLVEFEERLKSANYALPIRILMNNIEHFLSVEASGKALFVTGFTTIRPALLPVLRKLSQNAEIVISKPFELAASVSPLLEIAKSLQVEVSPEKLNPGSRIVLHHAGSILDEISGAVSWVKKLLDSKIPPSSIGILVPDEERYGPLLLSILRANGITVNYSLPFRLSRTPIGELFDCVARWDPLRTSVIEVASLSLHKMVSLGDHPGVSLALAHERDLHVLPSRARDNSFWTKKLSYLEDLFGFDQPDRPLSEWVEFMRTLLANLNQSPTESERDLQASFDSANQKMIDALSQCANMSFELYSPRAFWNFLASKVLSTEVRVVGYPLKDVQVLSIKESRHIPFEHIFVVGMLEGTFPAALPKDSLIEDWLKKKANLPGWNYVEAMEDTTFGLLIQKDINLCFSWPKMLDGRETVPSRFIERLKAQKFPVVHLENDQEVVFRSTNEIPNFDLMEVAASWEKSVFTPSNVDILLECPWRYYLQSKGLRSWELCKPKEDFRSDGNWLHRVLEVFFTNHQFDLSFASRLDEETIFLELSRIADECASQYSASQSTQVLMELKGWREISRLIRELYRDWQGGQREVDIPPSASLLIEGQAYPLRGRLDALDSFSFGHVIIDYKRGSLPEEIEVRKGKKPQLPLYAHAFGLQKSVLAYWSFKNYEVKVIAKSPQIETSWDKYRPAKASTPEACLEKFKINLAWRLAEEMVSPDPGKHCTYCPYSSSCRIHDPRASEKLLERARWEIYAKSL